MTTPLASRAAAHLLSEVALPSALLGFDGFIDTILHVVDTRQSASEYTRVRTIQAYGERILGAVGLSTNIEIVPITVKLGGNGPIMANAMCALGTPTTYCGMTGYPTTQEVFRDLGEHARLLPLADAALTDAFEFDDGKLIIGKHATVAQVAYETILQRVTIETWSAAWHEAGFIGMVNWTMLPYLTELWHHLLQGLEEHSDTPRKTIFFDLADPEKRTTADIHEALTTIAAFEKYHNVILGLNEKEAMQVVRNLEIPITGTGKDATVEMARSIRAHLGISLCVVHPTAYATAADANGEAVVDGPFTPHPKISTGAGDHFNAGFCVGYLLGGTLEEALQTGVGTSGFYVRNAASPTRAQLAEFLQSL